MRYSYVRVETGYPQYINEGWLKCYPRKNQDEMLIKALYSENDIGEEPWIKPLRKIGYRDWHFVPYLLVFGMNYGVLQAFLVNIGKVSEILWYFPDVE